MEYVWGVLSGVWAIVCLGCVVWGVGYCMFGVCCLACGLLYVWGVLSGVWAIVCLGCVVWRVGYCMFAGLGCGLLYVWVCEPQLSVHLWSILNEGNMSGGTFVVPVVYISTERDVSLATLCEGT